MKHDGQGPQTQQHSEEKQTWEEPKLSYVAPKLTTHGELKALTGFLGGFNPGMS